MKLVERQRYIEKITKWFGKDMAIVLTGQRRVGKSCILRYLCEKLSEEGNVIFIDKEQRQFDGIRTYIDLNEYIDAGRREMQLHYD